MQLFSKLIKQKRKEKRMSLKQLSVLAGIPHTTIHHYEQGTQPPIDKADVLLKALGAQMTLGLSDPPEDTTP